MTTQTYAGLTWERCLPEVGEGMLDDLERQFSVKLPPTARELMRRCHGGRPAGRSEFSYRHPGIGAVRSGLGALLPIDPANRGNIERILGYLAVDDQLPAGLIPFGTDGGGDYICLDYREGRQVPTVSYWMHELEGPGSVARLADSIEDFLTKLEPDTPLPAELR